LFMWIHFGLGDVDGRRDLPSTMSSRRQAPCPVASA
jgi:hypothetical protein